MVKVVLSVGVLIEIFHGGSTLEGRSLSCETKRYKSHGKEKRGK